ncbi:type II toxin-antitoxin system RelE/ParE family toxin [Dyadobacter endophyticus]|uniref:Protein killer protein n=1 Tax=Dyadobacter endophyticus TaxID=1749036 RepID=A0ABQ1YVB6_9BACT|nr:type II toxin-antitoxin system RelE/ParE family toxin [Dyadobacter endophyticus]GGH40234.1 protein killer protein [Dyadobacter endophyticus]
MINSFKHKGLRLFFETDNPARLQPHHVEKIRRILYRLDEAHTLEQLDIVGWNLHPLKGAFKNHWSVKVNGNYRITFRFEHGQVFDVDYLDYH